jgi:rhodanese-related sulfurtransferase
VSQEAATEHALPPARVTQLLESGDAQLIDVRHRYEWEAGRIEGARHIEINELTGEAGSIARERPVIFYCRSGSRSGVAAAAFSQAGWDAYNLEGGLRAWVDQGLPLDPPHGEVAEPRPGS